MGRGNPNPKHKWKKGESGNPKGAPALPPEIVAARRLTTENYIAIINEMSGLGIGDLQKIREDKATNSLRACVAAAILYTWAKGDPSRLEILLNRAIGPVSNVIKFADEKEKIIFVRAKSNQESQEKPGGEIAPPS